MTRDEDKQSANDAQGRPVRTAAVVEDVTERRRMEGELLFQARVLGHVNDAVVAIDDRGRITYFNRAAERQYGVEAARAVGLQLCEVYEYRWARPEDEVAAAEALARTGYWRGENLHVRRDGVTLRVESAVTALKDEAGGAAGLLAVIRDIGERKLLEDALRRAHDELEQRVEERTRELQELTGQLLAEVKERAAAEGRVKQLLGRLVTVQEEDRRRIARELHDTLGQQLTALRLSIDMIKAESEGRARLCGHIGRTQAIFDRLNAEVDFLAWELRPAALDMLGLDAAFQTFVQEWGRHFRIEAEYRGRGLDGPRPSAEVETNLYRTLQEALQNVHKHAGATRASVLLERRDGQVALIVEDDGRGYDPEEEEARGTNKGMGVTNMRERAALVGGTFEIESAPGAGATVYVRVPFDGGCVAAIASPVIIRLPVHPTPFRNHTLEEE